MSVRKDRGPVPKEAFLAMKSWLDTAWSFKPEHSELTNDALGQEENNVQEWLGQLASDPWPERTTEYKTFQCEESTQHHYLKISTQARKSLAVACRALGFQYCAATAKSGLTFRVAWTNYPNSTGGSLTELPDGRTRITRIKWLRIPHPGSFSDLVLLGASTMANALGVNLEVHDLNAGDSLLEEVERVKNSMGDNEEHRHCSFVLELADAPEAELALSKTLSAFRVIATGAVGATIAQDDTRIGIELGNSLIRWQPPGGKCKIAVITSIEDQKPGKGHRIAGFTRCIEEAMRPHSRTRASNTTKYALETISIRNGDHRHAHDLCVQLLNTKDNPQLFDCDVVFSAAGEFAEGLLRFFDVNPQLRPPAVFTADISPSLLNLMWEPDSTLQAMCGVEPFSYGRLIVRAACETGGTRRISVPVTQLQRQDVLNAGIRNYAQLLAVYHGLLLDYAEFE